MKRDRTLKPMEFEDAPSGFVHLYNYKEPLMKFKQGFGFQGVLLMDGNTDKVQCHLCGEWFTALPYHIFREHNIRAAAYKELVGLSDKSALVSERLRERLIASGLQKRLKNLRKGRKKTKEEIEKIKAGLKKWANSIETKNKQNCCPEQLLERLRKKAEEMGRTPSSHDISFEGTLIRAFGTYRNACELAGLKPNALGKPPPAPRIHTRAWFTKEIKRFVAEHGRLPSYSDARRKLFTWNHVAMKREFGGGMNEVLLQVLGKERVHELKRQARLLTNSG